MNNDSNTTKNMTSGTNISNGASNLGATSSYMGNISSKDVGLMPYAGRLGGEMVRRMIKAEEERLTAKYQKDKTF